MQPLRPQLRKPGGTSKLGIHNPKSPLSSNDKEKYVQSRGNLSTVTEYRLHLKCSIIFNGKTFSQLNRFCRGSGYFGSKACRFMAAAVDQN